MYLRYYDFLNYVLFRSGQKFTFYKKCVHKHFTLTLKKIFIINTFDNKCGHRNGWDMNDFCRLRVWCMEIASQIFNHQIQFMSILSKRNLNQAYNFSRFNLNISTM